MEKVKYMNVTLFDSTDLRVGVNVLNRKKLNDKEIDLVVQNNDYISINPRVYVIWSFKDSNGQLKVTAHTSYPHIRMFRKIMENIVDSYTDINGIISENFSEKKIVTSHFGNERQTMVFTTQKAVINGDAIPIVKIELLNSDGEIIAGAILTLEQFTTLATVIADVNLTTIQTLGGIAYLQSEDRKPKAPTLPNRAEERLFTKISYNNYSAPNYKK